MSFREWAKAGRQLGRMSTKKRKVHGPQSTGKGKSTAHSPQDKESPQTIEADAEDNLVIPIKRLTLTPNSPK